MREARACADLALASAVSRRWCRSRRRRLLSASRRHPAPARRSARRRSALPRRGRRVPRALAAATGSGAGAPGAGRARVDAAAHRRFPGGPRAGRARSHRRCRRRAGHSLYGDTLWAFGLFDEAERAYETALKADIRPTPAATTAGPARWPRAAGSPTRWSRRRRRCGSRRATPRSTTPSASSTSASTTTRKRRAAFGNYVNLLPNRDHSEKAEWSRAEIRFLRSFKGAGAVRDATRAPPTRPGPVRFRIDRRQGGRPRQGQRRRASGVRRSTPAPSRPWCRATSRSGAASCRSPTRSAPASATSACAACRSARIDSLEIGDAQGAQRPVPDQEPAAARHAGA